MKTCGHCSNEDDIEALKCSVCHVPYPDYPPAVLAAMDQGPEEEFLEPPDGYVGPEEYTAIQKFSFIALMMLVLTFYLIFNFYGYFHNVFGFPTTFQGGDIYPGYGPFDTLLGQLGFWVSLIAGYAVIWSLRRHANDFESERLRKAKKWYFPIGLLMLWTAVCLALYSSFLRSQAHELEQNLGVATGLGSLALIMFLIFWVFLIIGVILLYLYFDIRRKDQLLYIKTYLEAAQEDIPTAEEPPEGAGPV